MQITDIINILGNEFSSIYCVNRQDQYIQIYRHQNADLDESMNEKQSYKTVIQKYIETNVFEEERKKMLVATDFDNICRQLQQVAQFTVHYRIKNNNDILRYRMKCARIGNADTFEKIVFAFASEDSDIRLDELGMMNLSNTGEKRKILIVENDEFNLKSLISLLADRYEIITACDGINRFEITGRELQRFGSGFDEYSDTCIEWIRFFKKSTRGPIPFFNTDYCNDSK